VTCGNLGSVAQHPEHAGWSSQLAADRSSRHDLNIASGGDHREPGRADLTHTSCRLICRGEYVPRNLSDRRWDSVTCTAIKARNWFNRTGRPGRTVLTGWEELGGHGGPAPQLAHISVRTCELSPGLQRSYAVIPGSRAAARTCDHPWSQVQSTVKRYCM
jgi:hypothetical protein